MTKTLYEYVAARMAEFDSENIDGVQMHTLIRGAVDTELAAAEARGYERGVASADAEARARESFVLAMKQEYERGVRDAVAECRDAQRLLQTLQFAGWSKLRPRILALLENNE